MPEENVLLGGKPKDILKLRRHTEGKLMLRGHAECKLGEEAKNKIRGKAEHNLRRRKAHKGHQ